jgi:serine/threonine protein phosphatase PrpC
MTKPEKTKSLLCTLENCAVQTSYCVIPGLDPRGIETKVCQDNLCVNLSQGHLLAALFDGHGSFGRPVAEACTLFITQNYEASIDMIIVSCNQKSPNEGLTKLVEDCDRFIVSQSGIDTSLSGSTAVLLLITPTHVYSANLGDSRGVLGRVPGRNDDLRSTQEPQKDPFKRQAIPGRIVVSVAMTLDQKPNLEGEMKRIRQAGGLVQKITDASGRRLGPYRVWKPGTTLPGLVISRSIGDSVAKSVGVIPTPVVQKFSTDFERDLFAVIASDGVW